MSVLWTCVHTIILSALEVMFDLSAGFIIFISCAGLVNHIVSQLFLEDAVLAEFLKIALHAMFGACEV